MSTTVRIPKKMKKLLASIAAKKNISQQAVLMQALEDLQRKLHWEQFNQAYSTLREDPERWEDEESERSLWDSTLADGLDEEEGLR